jgi:hypothetical protein
MGKFSQIWLQANFESKSVYTSFYIFLATLLEPCVAIVQIFLKLCGIIMAIENLPKMLDFVHTFSF